MTLRTNNKMGIKKTIYFVLMLFLTLSGFGQMPVFKRYYIADIPGLGWLAEFYVTHLIHYICATVLLGFIAFVAVDFFYRRREFGKLELTATGKAKVFVLSGLVLSGALLVVRNLPGVWMPHAWISGFDLIHLGLVMVLMGISTYGVIKGKKAWVR